VSRVGHIRTRAASATSLLERAGDCAIEASRRALAVRAAFVRRGARAAILVALATGFSLTACDARSTASGEAPAATGSFAVASTSQPLLDLVPDAPFATLYGGKRSVYFSYRVNEVPVTVDYTEQVFADGQGNFTVMPLEVTEPPMSTQGQDLFKLLQSNREGFMYRHRDFRVRDLALFEQQYSVTDLGSPVTVCGRSCAWIEMKRLSGAQSSYRAWIDQQTGLILRYEELASSGQLEARVEFTDFTLAPDLTGVVFHTDDPVAQPLDLGTDTTPQIGFPVHAPSLLPSGFQLEKSEQVDDGSQKWARLTYSDGAEQLFYLYCVESNPTAPAQQRSQHAGNHGPKRTMHVFHFGPWIVAQGNVDDRRLIAVGKTSETALLQMVQSALH
jgi:hypothetical protein